MYPIQYGSYIVTCSQVTMGGLVDIVMFDVFNKQQRNCAEGRQVTAVFFEGQGRKDQTLSLGTASSGLFGTDSETTRLEYSSITFAHTQTPQSKRSMKDALCLPCSHQNHPPRSCSHQNPNPSPNPNP